jgi:TANFOR domain-containing protein
MSHKRIFNFLLLFCLIVGSRYSAKAQLFPIQASTQLLPPYSVYLSDYATPGSEKLRVILVQGDFTQPEYQLRLVMSIELDGRIIMRTSRAFNPPPLSVSPGIPTAIAGTDLAPYLDSKNIDFIGYSREQYERTRALPEGGYRIIFTAYDYRRQDVQVSNQASSFYYLAKNEPPLVNFPACGTRISITTPQQIIFSWLPRNTASPTSAGDTQYEFSLYEVRPANRNPNDVVLTTPPVYQILTDITQLVYGPAEPMLIENMQYVWRVRAIDRNGRDAFRNNGFSEVCTFTYAGIDANSLLAVSGVQAAGETERRGKVWWTAEGYESYRVHYKKRGIGFEWFKQDTDQGELKLLNLEPSLEYETRVQGKKGGVFGPYSSIVTFKTKPKVEKDCGYPTGVPQDTGKPYVGAYNGLIVNARGLDMELKEVTALSEPGWYKGVGICRVPYLGGSGYHAKFERIYINDNLEVILGRIDFVSKGIASMTAEQLAGERRINRERRQRENRTQWSGTDFYEGIILYKDTDIETIEPGPTSTSNLLVTDKNGDKTENAEIIQLLNAYPTKALIIEDKNGDQWVVQKGTDGKPKVTKVEGGGLGLPSSPRNNCPPNVNCDISIVSTEGEAIIRLLADAKDVSDPIKYPGIKIYHTTKVPAAVTLPGIGIFINNVVFGSGNELLKVTQHEYGHFIDYSSDRKLDLMPPGVRLFGYYTLIGLPSIYSASVLQSLGGNHSNYWTEVRANKFAKDWFKDAYVADEVNYPTEVSSIVQRERSREAAYGTLVYSTASEDLFEYPDITIQDVLIRYNGASDKSFLFFQDKYNNSVPLLNTELLYVLWQNPNKHIIIQDKEKSRWKLARDPGTGEPVVSRITGAYTNSIELVKKALANLNAKYGPEKIKELEANLAAKEKEYDQYINDKNNSLLPTEGSSTAIEDQALLFGPVLYNVTADNVNPKAAAYKDAELDYNVAVVTYLLSKEDDYDIFVKYLKVQGKTLNEYMLSQGSSQPDQNKMIDEVSAAIVDLVRSIVIENLSIKE